MMKAFVFYIAIAVMIQVGYSQTSVSPTSPTDGSTGLTAASPTSSNLSHSTPSSDSPTTDSGGAACRTLPVSMATSLILFTVWISRQ